MAQPNANLKAFHDELRELLKKYNIALDIKAEIVAVDLTKLKPQDAEKIKESVGLVGD